MKGEHSFKGSLMVKSICFSHIGMRPNHEDNFFLNGKIIDTDTQRRMPEIKLIEYQSNSISDIGVFAVSDGMGGHKAGEIASSMCVQEFARLNVRLNKCIQGEISISELVTLAQKSINKVNVDICNNSRQHNEMRGMGATVVALMVCGTNCAVLNVGDSRAYSFSSGTLTQITKDNTEGQRMLDLGILSRKELLNFPARKNLNRYLGYGENGFVLQADVYYPQISDGDTIILCSDGVTDSLTESEIKEILCSENDISCAGKKIIEQAVIPNNADNATAMLIKIGR